MARLLVFVISFTVRILRAVFRSRADLVIENVTLRQMVFLRNHKDVIAAMDLFTVPTVSLRVLYGFFVIDHSRRRILHFSATFNPTAVWVIQQLREAFPFDTAPKYLIFDRDAIFNAKMVGFVKVLGIKPCRRQPV